MRHAKHLAGIETQHSRTSRNEKVTQDSGVGREKACRNVVSNFALTNTF